MIVAYLPTTRDRVHASMISKEMYLAVKETFALSEFNASELISKDIQDMFSYFRLLKSLGQQLRAFKVESNSTFMTMFQAHAPDVANTMPNLRELIIKRSGNVNYLFFLCELRTLRKLTLDKIAATPSQFKLALLNMGSKLTYLSIGNNDQLSISDIVYIAEQCSNLDFLDVTGTKPLPTTAVRAILLHCPMLRSLLFTPKIDPYNTAQDWMRAIDGSLQYTTYHAPSATRLVDHKKHLEEIQTWMHIDMEPQADFE